MGDDDVDLIQELAQLPISGSYTPQEKFQDFRQMFSVSEQGKRVLYEILSHCHIYKSSVNGPPPIDTNAVIFSEGERNVALWLLKIINNEPKVPPTKAERKLK